MASISPKAVSGVANYLIDQLQNPRVYGNDIIIVLPATSAAGRENIEKVVNEAGAFYNFLDDKRLLIKTMDPGQDSAQMRQGLIGKFEALAHDPASTAAHINNRQSRAEAYSVAENARGYHLQNSASSGSIGRLATRIGGALGLST